jgi:dsDNA-specific endonuclease/ATPase MutS2
VNIIAGTLSGFQIGEKVSFLYEKGTGVVVNIDASNFIIVQDEDGFDRKFRASELARIHGTEYHLPDDQVAQINEDDSISEIHHRIFSETPTGAKRPIDVWELDLHIEALMDSHKGMSNAEILNFQLKEMRNFFKKAQQKHIRKIVLIHGVGEGILKEEVRSFLAKKEGVEYYDADFREYGKGATTAEIHYNIH